MSRNAAVLQTLVTTTVLALLAGCQDSNTADEGKSPPTDMTSSSSADLTGVLDQGMMSGGAKLSGTISRTATPKAGGKGPLYVAVFEGNPVVDSKNAVLVAQTVVTDADLSAPDAKVSYRIEGIAPSARERQVLAFLDDNRTARPPAPGPDAGDLVTLDGIGGIKVTLSMEKEVPLNLVLNAVIPKL